MGLLLSLLTAVFSILAIYIFSHSIASSVFCTFILVVGHIYCESISAEARQRGHMLLYVTIALLHYSDIMVNLLTYNYDRFLMKAPDQWLFYNVSEVFSHNNFSYIIYKCFEKPEYVDLNGYLFYISVLAYIANVFFDGNCWMLQILGSTLFGVLSTLVIYKMFLLFVGPKKAFKYALFFCSLSFFAFFSPFLMRDIHIALIIVYVTYIVLKPFSAPNVVRLIMLTIVAYSFRSESGLFLLVFIGLYYWNQYRKRVDLSISILIILFVGMLISIIVYQKFVLTTGGYYDKLFSQVGNDSNSSYNMLPSYLVQPFLFVNSQITVIPNFKEVLNSDNLCQTLLFLLEVTQTYLWTFISVFLLKWLFIDKRRKKIPTNIMMIYYISILFIAINTFDMASRRIFGVYPFMFILFAFLMQKYHKREIKKFMLPYLVIYTAWCAFVMLVIR